MKRLSKKIIIYIISTAVLLSVLVGVTVAYLISKTTPLGNEFTPVTVSCTVEDSDPSNAISNLVVKNTGDVKAYARCVIITTYVNQTDGATYSDTPILGVDYKVTLGSDWTLASDGFYYYASSVQAGSSTSVLISSVTELNSAPAGYELMVSVYASMIQAEPKIAVEQTWGVTVLDNGNIYKG